MVSVSRAPRTPATSSGARGPVEDRFTRRRRANRWRAARPVVVILVVLVLLGAASWALLASPWFAVREVTVTGTVRLAPAQVRATAAVRVGEPLILVRPGDVAGAVSHLPEVAAVTVRRHWPNQLLITVDERQPVAVLVPTQGGARLLVDRVGVPFALAGAPSTGAPSTGAPVLPVISDVPATATARLAAAAAVTAALPSSLAAQVLVVRAASPQAVTLRLRGGATVVWGDASNSHQKATVLAALVRAQPARVYDVSAPDAPTTRQ